MTANDFFAELLHLAVDSTLSARSRYNRLYTFLLTLLDDCTRQEDVQFSGPFARLVHLCRKVDYGHEGYVDVNTLRLKCVRLSESPDDELASAFASDLAVLCRFAEACYAQSAPISLLSLLPDVPNPHRRSSAGSRSAHMRVVVEEFDDSHIRAVQDGAEDAQVNINYGQFPYLREMLRKGARLNVVGSRLVSGAYYPELLVYEPDYLVDITSVAGCFTEYCDSPLLFLLNRFKPSPNTRHILLGNLAGQMLDEEIHHADAPFAYNESVRRFFKSHPIDLAACPDSLADFHGDAQWQQGIIRTEVQHFGHRDQLILEPSFVCELLGLQGRMDLLSSDLRMLVEQKSGKRDEMRRRHKENHYVQMLLYLAMLHYAHGIPNDEVECYLFYSQYADGLLRESPAPQLLAEAMRVRNEIVALEYQMADGRIRNTVEALEPEFFRQKAIGDRFWTNWIRPQLAAVLGPIHNASPIEKDYFYRYVEFVARELLLAKTGAPLRGDFGFSSLWNSRIEDRVEGGDTLHDIAIRTLDTDADGGICRVVLRLPERVVEGQVLPNFRMGDIVLLYSYDPESVPDVRSGFVYRCTVADMDAETITLDLRFPQKNRSLFPADGSRLWAVEHDFMESGYTSLFRGLHALLCANPDRRALLLGQRSPRVDESVGLRGDYGDFNPLVLSARQAKDYFLIVGPPGTGKTSFGLMNVVREELFDPNASVLLLAYTNRAVDEICAKLDGASIDFVRIGSAVSCPEAYRSHLLRERMSDLATVGKLKQFISAQRVYVSTTTSISSNLQLFSLRQFSLAVIDEASQILEPNLLGILSAHVDGRDCIGRFVLIGDHKQLPSIVLQTTQQAAVREPRLRAHGLHNCGQSLFERLLGLHGGNPAVVYGLTRQGRMHPEVAEFANSSFYGGHLSIVGHPHQSGLLPFTAAADGLDALVSGHRMLFFDVRPGAEPVASDKVNDAEADLIVRLALSVHRVYLAHGRPFEPDDTLGIIVPYRHQIANIRRRLACCGIESLSHVSVDTVERFQGSQRNVIIYGFTVQRPYQLTFLESNVFEENGTLIDRKLNVALTRAKEQQFVVGNADLLRPSPVFRPLLEYAERRKIMVTENLWLQ